MLRPSSIARFALAVASTFLAPAASLTRPAWADEAAPPPPAGPATPPAAPTPDTPSPDTPAAPKTPRLCVESLDCDLGALRQEERREATFRLHNDGTAPLDVSGRGSCGCTVVTLSCNRIEPGGDATLTTTVATGRSVGRLHKSIWLTSNDPGRAQTELVVRADVRVGTLLAPSSLYAGPVIAGTSPTPSVEVRRRDGVALHVLSAEFVQRTTGIESATLALEPIDEPASSGGRVVLHFATPPPVGVSTGTVRVRTDDPDTATLDVPVVVSIASRVVVGPTDVNVGTLRPSDPPRAVAWVRAFDASVALHDVRVKARDGRLVVAAGAVAHAPGTFEILVAPPDGAKAGPIEDVLLVTTDVEGEPETRILVRAEAASASDAGPAAVPNGAR